MGSGKKSLPSRIRWYVYLSHALSTWGDRMWAFGVGLFLVIISPESLRVTAVYGFSVGIATLLFGALIGDWVDRTPRLQAAKTSLFCQNSSVIICTCIVFVVITYKEQIQTFWPDEGLLTLCYAVIIAIAIVSNLASMATSIAVQKDWIVEICERDKDLLASTSAILRRIDLIMNILAPIATGQIMTHASVGGGALFIGGWNLLSVFLEFFLLWKVYHLVPSLRKWKQPSENDKEDNEGEEMVDMVTAHDDSNTMAMIVSASNNPVTSSIETVKTSKMEENVAMETKQSIQSQVTVVMETNDSKEEEPTEVKALQSGNQNGDKDLTNQNNGSRGSANQQQGNGTRCGPCCRKMFSSIFILIRGWRTYMKYEVAFAGLGLASLYMTVLGFDNITVGFTYTQGINESVMGILMAAAALTGILGTILYPIIRRKIGLERTGLFGFFFEIIFLTLCVASIWAPGSPFDPFLLKSDTNGTQRNCVNKETVLANRSFSIIDPSNDQLASNFTYGVEGLMHNERSNNDSNQLYRPGDVWFSSNATESACVLERHWQSYISVALLMAGIIGARCGLWMADLTITQLFLENIQEHERGIVNGVQSSLNKVMDMLKFILVILAPQPHLFGILILISFTFICIGWLLYARYSYKMRGHLFHFDKITKCSNGHNVNNNIPAESG